MNIGIDIRAARWYRGTGIGTYTYQLINALNNSNYDNTFTLFSDNTNLDLNFKSNFKLVTLPTIQSNNFWDNVKIPATLTPDMADIYHTPQNGIGLPTNHDVPFVITLHDTIPLHMPETVGENYLNLFNTHMKSIIDRCDGIITVSEFSRQDISKDFNFPKEKIHVTYLASEPIYKPTCKHICTNILKKHYFIPNNYILYVGGFSPRKNISGLIEAFSLIKNKLPKDMYLVIAGTKGKSYSIYKALTDKLNLSDRVLFPGFIEMEHMPYLYGGATLLVYPSFYEGFGLPPIEAMACGTPVIASNVTSIPEILEDSALLCDPYDIDLLGESILSVILDKNLTESLINKGFSKASSLSWNFTAKQTMSAYAKIISSCN